MLDEQGRITRWHATGTDIEDRKETEQRLRNENVALREEIDKASMFEEIVGTSPALQTVLSRVSKVAPSDSSVLITGETGTGKELVARAIHRRSRRVSRAFVSVNCAAIPRDLIASECWSERRKGGETGVKAVQLLEGDDVWVARAAGRWSNDLLSSAFSRSSTPLGLAVMDGHRIWLLRVFWSNWSRIRSLIALSVTMGKLAGLLAQETPVQAHHATCGQLPSES